MTTSSWSNLSQDIKEDIFSLYNVEGKLCVFRDPKVAKTFYLDRTFNHLQNEFESGGVELYEKLLRDESIDYDSKTHKVIISFYELGHHFERTRILDNDTPLALWLEYSTRIELEDDDNVRPMNPRVAPISYEVYKKAFDQGREHLKRGDCYQYNLTFPQELIFDSFDDETFIKHWLNSKRRGEFANLTSFKDRIYFSNSPECLFDLKIGLEHNELTTKPIKGTISLGEHGKEAAWTKLLTSQKNQSELYMITDLLRNDLNRIEEPKVEVVALKECLEVPGLLHSYSELKINLSKKVNLLQIMKAIFPGGSITGAPKKRVMEIIDHLELGERGFYCGSTILKSSNTFKASINIRSGIVDRKMAKVQYWSGGGVTIQSHCDDEYQEVLDKTNSFVRFLS